MGGEAPVQGGSEAEIRRNVVDSKREERKADREEKGSEVIRK